MLSPLDLLPLKSGEVQQLSQNRRSTMFRVQWQQGFHSEGTFNRLEPTTLSPWSLEEQYIHVTCMYMSICDLYMYVFKHSGMYECICVCM